MENLETQKNSNWSILIACLALLIGCVALALSWQTHTSNQKDLSALSVLQLRAAALSSRPYDAELRYLKEISGEGTELDGVLASLTAFALTGLPRLQSLDEEFQKAAAAALLAEQSRPWLGFLESVTSHIAATAVEIGMEAGSNTFESALTAAISSAKGFLLVGQLPEAVEAINDVPAEFGSYFAAWKSTAESRVVAENALNELVEKFASDAARAK